MKAKYTEDSHAVPGSTNITVLVACRIAARYADRVPSAKQLIDEFGRSLATANRWRSAIRQARQGAA